MAKAQPGSHAYTERQLRERVKELQCLFEISRVLRRTEEGLETVLARVAGIIPNGFQYPERAGARVRLGGVSRQTSRFAASPFLLSAPIIAPGITGSVDVSYPPDIVEVDPDPFLAEEARLLEEIGREIALTAVSLGSAERNSRLEAQLRHADRLATLGVLAAGIAHELNEPLSRILGFAQLAQRHPGLAPAVDRDLGRIVDASLHAREIVQKLLAFGRGTPAQAVDCDMDPLVAGALDFLEARCRAAGIEVRREPARRRLFVGADPTELRQVIVNLVVNAVQAMPSGGRLTVRVEERDEFCLLTVEDTGVGMTPEVLDRIFTPFFTTKDGGRGTGLGLPLVHGIVTSLGGALSVQSTVGTGSRFVVRLPMRPAEPAGTAGVETAVGEERP
jgi:two-component system, NtrC family, sensor kinase